MNAVVIPLGYKLNMPPVESIPTTLRGTQHGSRTKRGHREGHHMPFLARLLRLRQIRVR